MTPHSLFEAVVRCLSSHPHPFAFLSHGAPLGALMGTLRAVAPVLMRPASLAVLLVLYAARRQEWEQIALSPEACAPASGRVSKTLAQGRLGWADIVFALRHVAGPKVSEKTITRALKQLQAQGLVACHVEQRAPRRCSYSLTDKAEHLCLFLHLLLWSQAERGTPASSRRP